MEFFDTTRDTRTSKNKTEIVDKQKHEFKFVGSVRKRPGMTTFSLNIKTGEIKEAPLKRTKDIHYTTKKPVKNDQIIVEPDCIYRQALNKKNFVKHLVREGILARREPGQSVKE